MGVYRGAVPQCLYVDHFELVNVIGRGGFSKVLRSAGRLYAMKTMSKDFIVQEQKSSCN